MTQDIIRMAREANRYASHQTGDSFEWQGIRDERFAALAAAAQREKLAHWMRSLGYATGHGDSIEEMLDHLGTQIAEGLEAEVLMEREACADICDQHASVEGIAQRCAEQIRARGKT
jgi:phosphatidylserine/phosphatidylglycerophosphate/cardiolipin synthase-like enzyme